ncbi:MAG: SynChlorMet cassette protein ScmC [Dethiobacteria bacterium]|nr:SynChlorMet cassette protein ScmC [Dethiobacteria bacterium]
MEFNPSNNCPVLKLANSLTYSFLAGDSSAEACVEALARAMRLERASCQGRKIILYTSEEENHEPKIFMPADQNEPILCLVNPYDSQDLFYIQVERAAQAIAADVISKGGALVHGGLCSLNGCGAIMAGRGGIGKTTASGRLSAPWISYSDDSTLVIPDGREGYVAHPWPTWSRFYWGGEGGSWPVENALPLTRLFFLSQAESDSLEAIDCTRAKSMLIDTIEHVTRSNRKKDKERLCFVLQCIESAGSIARAVPAYRLNVCLTGRFWEEMEQVMPTGLPGNQAGHASGSVEVGSLAAKPIGGSSAGSDLQYFIYRSTSMNPTFFEPEMLTVKPYIDKTPRRGDIICYHVPEKDEGIVHRVIGFSDSALKTRGDNNAKPDDYTVDITAVMGRVIAARRENEIRLVRGGFAGVVTMHLYRIYRKANRTFSHLFYQSYRGLAASGLIRIFKPHKMRFRVVVFERYATKHPKLILNGRTVGSFDYRKKEWKINRPYRLFIDEKSLPVFERPPYKLPIPGDTSATGV